VPGVEEVVKGQLFLVCVPLYKYSEQSWQEMKMPGRAGKCADERLGGAFVLMEECIMETEREHRYVVVVLDDAISKLPTKESYIVKLCNLIDRRSWNLQISKCGLVLKSPHTPYSIRFGLVSNLLLLSLTSTNIGTNATFGEEIRAKIEHSSQSRLLKKAKTPCSC
jgi:hypothetical protein